MEPQNNLIEPTNRNHRILFTVLIVFLTAGVIGGSTYYVMGQQAKKDKEASEKKLSEIQKQVDSLKKESKAEEKKSEATPVVKDETADWKTYTGSLNGFSIKYPKDWIVDDTSPVVSNQVPSPNPSILIKDNNSQEFRIYVSTTGTVGGWGVETVGKFITYKGTVSGNNITLTQEKNLDISGNGYYISSRFSNSGKDYLMVMTGDNKAESNTGDALLKKILKTIQFN